MKRLAAPRSWDISRKSSRFIYKPVPGPYATVESYPLGVVLRDLSAHAGRSRELKFILRTGKVLVDGQARTNPSFPVGLFNLVSVPAEGAHYRVVPSPKGLVLAVVDGDESDKKLCCVNTKKKVKGGKIQYGLHDGRSIVDQTLDLSPGDSVLIQVPSQRVLGKTKLAKGSIGLVLSGERAGESGNIAEVKQGTVSREKMVRISLPSGEAEIPSRLVFPVGTGSPAITVGASRQ